MCMDVLPPCIYVHYVHVWCPQRPEVGIESPRTGFTNDYVDARNQPGPLQEQQVLLSTKPTLWPCNLFPYLIFLLLLFSLFFPPLHIPC